MQDNLDRLAAEPAERLFIENGDLLAKLNAHVIYTAPVAIVLSAAANTGQVFQHRYTLPTVKVQERGGKAHKKGIDALIALVAARADLDKVFTNRGVIRYLAQMSGGSVRDLMRLLFEVQSLARADDRSGSTSPARRMPFNG